MTARSYHETMLSFVRNCHLSSFFNQCPHSFPSKHIRLVYLWVLPYQTVNSMKTRAMDVFITAPAPASSLKDLTQKQYPKEYLINE